MPRQSARVATGTLLLAAVALAGCSSTGAHATPTVGSSATAAPTLAEDPTHTHSPADAAPADTSAQVKPPQDATAPGTLGGDCAVNSPNVRVIVVQGAVDCATVNSVWATAVADPGFTVRGKRAPVVVDGWTCRPHAPAPVPTGFCEDSGYRNKFKIVRTG